MESANRKILRLSGRMASIATFYFFQHFDHPSSTTWQAWRPEFDKMIMDKPEIMVHRHGESKAKNLIKSADNRAGAVISDDLANRAPGTRRC